VLAGAAAQLAVPAVVRRVDPASLRRPNLDVQPVPATVAVWAPTMGLGALHAVAQARPGAAASPLGRRVGWPVAAAFASAGAWAPLVARGRWWPAQAAIASLAGFAALAAGRLSDAEREGGLDREARVLLAPSVAMLAGWGAAATGINLASILGAARERAQRPAALTAIAALGAGGAGAVRAAGPRTLTARTLGATVLWALGGVAAGQRTRFPLGAATAVTAAGPVAAALALPPRRRRDLLPSGRGVADRDPPTATAASSGTPLPRRLGLAPHLVVAATWSGPERVTRRDLRG